MHSLKSKHGHDTQYVIYYFFSSKSALFIRPREHSSIHFHLYISSFLHINFAKNTLVFCVKYCKVLIVYENSTVVSKFMKYEYSSFIFKSWKFNFLNQIMRGKNFGTRSSAWNEYRTLQARIPHLVSSTNNRIRVKSLFAAILLETTRLRVNLGN